MKRVTKVFKVPFNIKNDFSFDYNGITITITGLRDNKFLQCYVIDMLWAGNEINSIPLVAGVDLLKQYSTPLPNLYCFNTKVLRQDPTSFNYLSIYVIEEEDDGVYTNK